MKFVDLNKQYQHYKKEIDSQIFEVINSSVFIMGPKVKELEDKLAAYAGVQHGIGVSSGTDALIVSLMALGIGPGDEVITTPFTFIATAEVISFLRAKPVFADIDPDTCNIDPNKIETLITSRTKAIIPVSLYGQCADFIAINAIADKYNIPVIEDACQSFGAVFDNKRSCGLSLIGCTSFFPSKPIGCFGDGGMIFTSDDILAKKMREIMAHGQDRRYHHPVIGINGRLDAIQAGVLLAKFKHFPDEIKKRFEAGMYYTGKLNKIDGVKTPVIADKNTHVFAQYSIEVDKRDALVDGLKEMGIPSAVHYPVPLHLQPAFNYLGYNKGSFPVAEAVASRIMSLPMHPFIEKTEQDEVVGAINDILKKI